MNKSEINLLRKAFLTSIPEEPAQYDGVEPRFVFRPAGHMRALAPSNMLVSGARGVGKSFWWHGLQDEAIRHVVLDPGPLQLQTSAGFGEHDAENRPSGAVVANLSRRGFDAKSIWLAVVVYQLNQILPLGCQLPPRWDERVAWVDADPERVATILRNANDLLASAHKIHLILFDALDRTDADDAQIRNKLLRGLLQVTLDLRGRNNLRAKVFVRPDMLGSDVTSFPDASKIVSTRVDLTWEPKDLYGLVFNYLGNASDGDAAAAFRKLARGWTESKGKQEMPEKLRLDPAEQERVFVALAGPYMGKNLRQGKTYPWLPNHIADAARQVSPRSFLAAIRCAAEAIQPDSSTVLHWKGLQQGVRKASEIRVQEIGEDLPWINEAMRKLSDLLVPCERRLLTQRWQRFEGKLKPTELFEALVSSGILAQLEDGRVNVPDLYRVGFGLRRKGGLPPQTDGS